jgi:RIO kinase 3
MTFIGNEGKPAPTLKDAKLTEAELSKAWKQTVEMMIKLFRDCGLIHADLSEYNLLWHQNKIWCIDVSQSVFTTHPMAYKFLWRDCNNIHNVTQIFKLID